MEAAKDLRTACKIDFDDTADEWLKEVTPNVSERKRCSVIARSLLIPGPLRFFGKFFVLMMMSMLCMWTRDGQKSMKFNKTK